MTKTFFAFFTPFLLLLGIVYAWLQFVDNGTFNSVFAFFGPQKALAASVENTFTRPETGIHHLHIKSKTRNEFRLWTDGANLRMDVHDAEERMDISMLFSATTNRSCIRFGDEGIKCEEAPSLFDANSFSETVAYTFSPVLAEEESMLFLRWETAEPLPVDAHRVWASFSLAHTASTDAGTSASDDAPDHLQYINKQENGTYHHSIQVPTSAETRNELGYTEQVYGQIQIPTPTSSFTYSQVFDINVSTKEVRALSAQELTALREQAQQAQAPQRDQMIADIYRSLTDPVKMLLNSEKSHLEQSEKMTRGEISVLRLWYRLEPNAFDVDEWMLPFGMINDQQPLFLEVIIDREGKDIVEYTFYDAEQKLIDGITIVDHSTVNSPNPQEFFSEESFKKEFQHLPVLEEFSYDE